MAKRVLKVNKAIIMEWSKPSGVFVLMAHMAERDQERGWTVRTDIRTSTVLTLNGHDKGFDTIVNIPLKAGDVVETTNTIYEVVE